MESFGGNSSEKESLEAYDVNEVRGAGGSQSPYAPQEVQGVFAGEAFAGNDSAGGDSAEKASAKGVFGGKASAKATSAKEVSSKKTCQCHHKETPRSAAFQADLQKRLNRAIGQLNGVKGMLDDNRYCGDILVQLAAAESAVRSVSSMLLQDHLETCVVEQIRRGNDEVVGEVVQLVKRFAR